MTENSTYVKKNIPSPYYPLGKPCSKSSDLIPSIYACRWQWS